MATFRVGQGVNGWIVGMVVPMSLALSVLGAAVLVKFRTDQLWDWKADREMESAVQNGLIKSLELRGAEQAVHLAVIKGAISEIKLDVKEMDAKVDELLRRTP